MKINQYFPLYKRASLYLLGLACFFFWSYGLANQYTASLDIVPSVFYDWERHIPFLPWTIIPYWSMDLLYGLSFFLCRTKRELSVHAGRLFAASCVCCTFFILFPLSCSADIPPISNSFFRWLFEGGGLVATPYNQAPSLHIVLAWLVWLRFRVHTSGWKRLLLGGWFLLIGLSVLTCYQHHFIDVPLGFAVGVCISYLLPMHSYPRCAAGATDPKCWKLGGFYLVGSALLGVGAYWLKGLGWFLLWPASSLLVVGLGYWLWGVSVFQKDEQGHQSISARVLLAPYLWGAALSQRYFMRRIPVVSQVTDRLYVGRFPYAGEACAGGVVDLTAEFDSAFVACRRKSVYPCLDLLALSPEQLQQAVELVKTQVALGPTLVCCALGLSRSAAVAAAYLIAVHKVSSVQEAVAYIGRKRPQIIFSTRQINYLLQWEKSILMEERKVKSMAENFSAKDMETPVAGKVVQAFLSVTPQLLVVSLVAYATAIMGFNFFFNPEVVMDIIGAAILGIASLIGLWTMFLSVHLFVEGKLFEVLYNHPQDEEAFDNTVQYFWKAHRKNRSLESRWSGTKAIYFKAVSLCVIQWVLTLLGFALLAAGIH